MHQQGGAEQFRREEALVAVAFVSIHDPQFLRGARTNLARTLWRYGFALSPQEMQAVRDYLAATGDFTDQAIIDDLTKQVGEQLESPAIPTTDAESPDAETLRREEFAFFRWFGPG